MAQNNQISKFASFVAYDTSASNIAITTTSGSPKVGIGSTIPEQKLTVAGNVYVSGNIGIGITNPLQSLQVGTGVTVYGTSGIVSAIAFYGDGSNLKGVNAFNVINQSAISSPVYPTFATSTGVSSVGIVSTSPNAVVYVPSTGNLGIGTTNPQATLQVGTGVTVYGTTGIVSAIAFYGDGSNLRGVSAFNVINQSLTSTPVYPTFATSTGVSSVGIASTGFVYIPTSASVGIGTTNPQFKLDVVGDINSSTAIKVGGKNILDESLRLSVAFG